MSLLKHYFRILFWFIPSLSYQFSNKSIIQTIFLALKFYSFLFSRKLWRRNEMKEFSFQFSGKNFNLSLDSVIDISVLAEVFVLREYDWKLDTEPQVILDLGAHWGDSAIFYSLKYPSAIVYAAEPNPEMFQRLLLLAEAFPNIRPIQAAVAAETGIRSLFVTDSSLGNSFLQRSSDSKEIEVQTLTISDFADMADIKKFDLIKFDIEGAEKELFSDPSVKSFSQNFIGEIHLDLMDLSSVDVTEFVKGFQVEKEMINDQRFLIKAKRAPIAIS